MPDEEITLTGDENMANGASDSGFPQYSELGNLQGAMSAMVQGFSAAANRRVDRADQLSGDSSAMWSVALTSPTVMAAQGMRVASDAGSGRTRIESNSPAGTQTVGQT